MKKINKVIFIFVTIILVMLLVFSNTTVSKAGAYASDPNVELRQWRK